MNKEDKELMEILESELDKTLKFGCWVTHERVNNGEPEIIRLEADDYTSWYWEEAEVIGSYPTLNTILRYILKNKHTSLEIPFETHLEILYSKEYETNENGVEYDEFMLRLDITKEPIDYSKEEKRDLILFLKGL